jgi:tetracycline repressor-like protein
VGKRIVGTVAATLDVEDAPLRANLVSSQVVGLVMVRYIIRIEPLASLPPDELVEAIAPNLQRYLTRPLGTAA